MAFCKKRTGSYPEELVFDSKLTTHANLSRLNAMGMTLMAGSLYKPLGQTIGEGYERAKSRHIFRYFVDAVALLGIDSRTITVQFQKEAHNPLLLAA